MEKHISKLKKKKTKNQHAVNKRSIKKNHGAVFNVIRSKKSYTSTLYFYIPKLKSELPSSLRDHSSNFDIISGVISALNVPDSPFRINLK